MSRTSVKPALLQWACARSGLGDVELTARFPRLDAWIAGTKQPTFKQLESFANATHVAFGDLFLPEPPTETLPIADFRERSAAPPSGDLLDVIYAEQRRQDWFKEHATVERLDPVHWIGSATVHDSAGKVARTLTGLLDFEAGTRKEHAGWAAATKALGERIEAAGVLVSITGIVGSNTRRKLQTDEFRGFSLADDRAPLVFVNGADHKASQAFTLCHELAHLALGESGVSNEDLAEFRDQRVETWCDTVASEMLAPSDLVQAVASERQVNHAAQELTRSLRVSPLVAVRRVVERSHLPAASFDRCFRTAREALPVHGGSGGGDFYATALKRIGQRFARDVIASALEGNTTFIEAFRLLGIKNGSSFEELSRRVGLTQ